MALLSPNQSATLAALRAFLIEVLPIGTPVIQGQANRVPEPTADDFVIFWPLRRMRLATNVDSDGDAVFTGSIAGTTLTIDTVVDGFLQVGRTLFGTGVATNTTVTDTLSGTGGVGTYEVAPSQTAALQLLSAGAIAVMQETELTVQIDVHGPVSADNAQIISTMFRDTFAVEFFDDPQRGGAIASPLHADDPRQMPFTNENQQVENRWVLEACMQVNPVVTIPQQYMDVIEVDVISVDERYPP